MKLFNLERTEDESGISGTGVVAQGVEFDDGSVAMKWVSENAPSSMAYYDCIDDVETIHGHGGRTKPTTIVEVTPINCTAEENIAGELKEGMK